MLNSSHHFRRAVAFAAVGTLILGFTAPASATEAEANASATQGSPVTAKPVREKKYCFLFESTGTRMRSKVCRTKAEWEAQGQPVDMK